MTRTATDILLLVSRLLALAVIAVYAPVLLAVAMLVLLTSHGPAFVRRAYRRPNGDVVQLYEFRTECWSNYQETPVGSFLRRADFVRLPRLANVLMGQIAAGERVERLHH
ncbi:MAG TPA: sugar transferase [Chthonomonadaceae bacterium]|nr:sugar transferase [Chthonomonadaceae bacterium]